MIQSRPKTGAEKLRNINQKIWTLSPRMEKKKETRECKSEKRFLLTLSHKELFTKLLDLLRLLLNLCLCLSERRQRWQLAPLSSNFSPLKPTLMYKQWAGICTNKRICFSYKLLIAWPWVKESLKMQHIPASLAGCPKKKKRPKDWRSRGILPGCKTTPCHRILISVFRFLHPADKKKKKLFNLHRTRIYLHT